MAMLPFQHQELLAAKRRGLEIDHENNLVISSLDISMTAISLRDETPATLRVDAPDKFIALQYERVVVNVFEDDLRILGSKALHSFFLTAHESSYGVFTHLDVIAADPNRYLGGPLGSNMKRVGQGERLRHPTDARMRKLIQHARDF